MSFTSIDIHEIVSVSISGPERYSDPKLKGAYYKFVFKDTEDKELSISVHAISSNLLDDLKAKIIDDGRYYSEIDFA